MTRSLVLLLLLLGPLDGLGAAQADSAGRARLFEAGVDRELRHAFLPSARNVHGELRLLRRGDAWVLQTLLYTPQLRRGVQRMRRKELYAWPEGVPGFEDSQRYLADLEHAKDHVLERFAASSVVTDGRQKLMIELVLAPRDAFWVFYDVEVVAGAASSRATVGARTPFLSRAASRDYLRRAFVVQGETGFDDPPPELQELPR